jgi:hypothetical protein
MEHVCEEAKTFSDPQEGNFYIVFTDGKPHLSADGEYSTPIRFCPFCGKDLTAPPSTDPGPESTEPERAS